MDRFNKASLYPTTVPLTELCWYTDTVDSKSVTYIFYNLKEDKTTYEKNI